MERQPQHAVARHKEEIEASGLNTRVAVFVTKAVGNMWTAYVFVLLAAVGLLGILGLLNPVVILLVAWLSQTFLQLVFLLILSVGQSVLNRHQEIQSDEQYKATMNTYRDSEEIKQLLLEIAQRLKELER